jgi:hypothetical protein
MQASSSSCQHVLAGDNVATRAAMDPRNTRAEERDDLKSAVAPSASGIHANPSSSPPSGQDSLLNAKFALATTRALDNSKVDENDEEQGIPRKKAPDDASAAVENASDAASIRPGVVYHRHSKLEGRPRMDRDPEMCIDASESSDIPTSQRSSTTARLVEEDVQIGETSLPVSAQLVVRATPVQQLDHDRRRSRAWYGRGAVCAVLIILIAIVATTTTSRQSSKSTLHSKSQPTSTTPFAYNVFTRTKQLYDAVDVYLLAMREDESNNHADSTPLAQSNVSLTYRYPIGMWDVSRLTNFSRVLDPDRSSASFRTGTFIKI